MAKKTSSHRPFLQSLVYVVTSILVALIVVEIPLFHKVLAELGRYGYIGALLAGMFFVSVFTAAPAAVVLVTLAETNSILLISLIAGLGAVFGDYVIVSYLKSEAQSAVKKLPESRGILRIISILRHSKYRFLLSVLGAIVVASPLPDELGLSLMGLSSMKRSYFLWLSYILNTLGIYLLLTFVI